MEIRKWFRNNVPENVRVVLRDTLKVKKMESTYKTSKHYTTTWKSKYTKQLENQLKNNLQARLRTYYAENFDKIAIDDKIILFEVRDGTSFTDSPYAIFTNMVMDEQFSDFHFVISLAENKKYLFEELKLKYPDIQLELVIRETFVYMNMLLKAKYLINNSTFNSYFTKKNSQVYINTWHGTALKNMGFAYVQDPLNARNVLRNFLMTDYLLSPNKHMTNVFLNSYKLNGIWKGTVLEGGLPRNDFILQDHRKQVEHWFVENKLVFDTAKQNIIYMPTWRGTDVNGANDVLVTLKNEVEKLVEKFGNTYNIFIKVHPFIYNSAQNSGLLQGYLIPNSYDTNELFQATDILITDYSSVYFDFLITNCPILFYAWDNDVYEADRGMYFEADTLPGPIAYTFKQLVDNIRNIESIKVEYANLYRKNKKQFVNYDDGNVTSRYINRIFNNNKSEHIKEIKAENVKTKLLIHPGAMLDNGITNSFINLVSQLDYSKYDVTAFLHDSDDLEVINNFNRIDSRVRKMFKPGLPIYTLEENIADRYLKSEHIDGAINKFYPEKGYQRESSRLFGNTEFDISIDFSGYSYFWAKYLLNVGAKKKMVFMHNDLAAETNRKVEGKYPLRNDLLGLFTLYPKFNKILSVSYNLMEVNSKKLQDVVEVDQMGFVENSINIDNILENNAITPDEEVKKVNTKKILTISDTIKLFSNKKNIPDNFEIYHNTEFQTVESIAQYSYNGLVYNKIIMDGGYIGWASQQFLHNANDNESLFFFQSDKKIEIPVEFKNDLNQVSVRKNPIITAKCEILDSDIYNDSSLFITKLAVDRYQQYVYLRTKFNAIGWVNRVNIEPLESKGLFSSILSTLDSKIQQRDKIKRLDNALFAKLSERSVIFKFYGDIEKKTENWDINIPYVYKIIDRVAINDIVYSLLSISNYNVGWVRDDTLIFLLDQVQNFNEYEGADVNQKSVLYKGHDGNIKLYIDKQINDYIEVKSSAKMVVENISIDGDSILGSVYFNSKEYIVSSKEGSFEKLQLKNVLKIEEQPDSTYNLEKPLFLISEIISNSGIIYKILNHNNVFFVDSNSFFFFDVNRKNILQKYSTQSNSVLLKSGDSVWEQPYGTSENIKRVSSTYILKKINFTVDAEMKLLNGLTYHEISYQGQRVGWVNQKNIITHFGKDDFNVNYLPVSFKILNEKVKHIVDNIKFNNFEYLKQITEFDNQNHNIKSKQTYEFDVCMKLKNGNSYLRFSPNQQIKGWISEDNLLIPTKEVDKNSISIRNIDKPIFEDNFYISEKKVTSIVSFQNETAHAYSSYSNILENRSDKILNGLKYSSKKVVYFKSGFYYEIEFEDDIYYVPEKEIKVIYSEFMDSLPKKFRLKLKSTDIILSSMGRLSPEKNQIELVKAMIPLINKYPNLKLIILGKGPMEKELNNIIKQNELQNNVFLVGQYAYPFGIIEQTDIFVLPSVWEGQPMVLLEALALNKKIVSSDLSQNAYVLGYGKYGYVAKGKGQQELADAINVILSEDYTFDFFDARKYNKNAVSQFEKLASL
ncbi:glycosyltransferase [Leuconostoc carnosum]|uniref:CDP-glycerol glycerophosphotransferase family protein n=1 Tax=Leuconostoc carnosum TaxID=1252 RepID=UPI001239C92E|nr:CDP-glycerol glycerophosphotransferase family protein [Leuconostoc carnosum]KAA8362333.1 glycosyltransferase [Leuconostoc carnosum]KAA8366882.1 glycosyltransferase [Leuconostoc carnosum]